MVQYRIVDEKTIDRLARSRILYFVFQIQFEIPICDSVSRPTRDRDTETGFAAAEKILFREKSVASFVVSFAESAVLVPDPVNNKLVRVKIQRGQKLQSKRFQSVFQCKEMI